MPIQNVNLFYEINSNLYGSDGRYFGPATSLTLCKTAEFFYSLGFKDDTLFCLNVNNLNGMYRLKNGTLVSLGACSGSDYINASNIPVS